MKRTTTEHVKGVYERVPDSGIWWIRYADARGKEHREKVGRRGDAIDLYNKRKTEALQRKKLPERLRDKAVTFRTLCADAVEHAKAENSPKNVYELELKIAEWLPVFGDMKAEDITKQDIVRWLTEQSKARNWKPATRNRYQATFSLIFRVGIDNEKIDRNPASRIKRQREDNGRVRFLSDAEETALRGAISNPRFLAAFEISIYTGMRQSEQYSLKWSQVDLDKRMLHLPKTKNGNARYIPLHAVAVAAFERLKGPKQALGSVVFKGRKGASQGARGWFKDAVTRSGIQQDYTWHCNRHTFASRLVMAGVDLRTVGELLGHKTAQMVNRYSHLAPEHIMNAIDRLPGSAPVLKPVLAKSEESESMVSH